MKNQTQIVLSGCAGSGKTTVGKALAKRLNYRFLSAGEWARGHAASLGCTIQELQIRLAQNPEFDKTLDQRLTQWGRTNTHYVLDYRLGFHFLPQALHVYLDVSPEVAARRVAAQARTTEFAPGLSPQAVLNDLTQRNQTMRNRFIALYGIDFIRPEAYDLVVPTDELTVEQIVEHVVHRLHPHCNRNSGHLHD